MLLKTQFEIRYTNILDFPSRYKAIVSPFLRLATFNIHSMDTLEEFIVLNFNNEPNIIDLRWDKAIFYTTREVSSLYQKNGPTTSYFEIFSRLKELESFGLVQNMLLAKWWLNESCPRDEYFKRYIKKSAQVDGFELDDIAIIEEYTNNEKDLFKIEHGFFKPEKDLQRFGIPDQNGELRKRSGQMVQQIMVKRTLIPSLDEFQKMSVKLDDIYNLQFKK